MSKSIINQNMRIVLNDMFCLGVAIEGYPAKIKELVSMSYNSFNDTLYIETNDKYIVIESNTANIPLITEFDKTEQQINMKKSINGGVKYD